jgi:Tfp pilus assembly protein PilN
MALHVNLYHEVIRAKRQQQYDPLRLSILALLVVGVLMAGYYGLQLKRTSDARGAFNAQKAEFDRLSPQAKAAADREAELTKKVELAERLTNRMEKRFHWAPVLESIMAAVPANVQLTKLTGDTGKDKGGICQVNIEGIAAGTEPRAVAEDTRKSVAERLGARYPSAAAAFRSLDDSTERVKIDGKPMPSVVFAISVTFKAEAEPAPAPKRIAQLQ